jgi:hypothetical protein
MILCFYRFFGPFWRGPVFAMFLHDGGHDATEPGKPKTYGRFLVRFFCVKIHFNVFSCGFGEPSRASFTPSMI